MGGYDSNFIGGKIPEDAVFVIGAGHFGSRAARIISEKGHSEVIVVDVDEKRLSQTNGLNVKKVAYDGIRFLVENTHRLSDTSTVIPAIPKHVAFEWLRGSLEGSYEIRQITVPEKIIPDLPHTWPASEGSLLISYADFMCPEDCPEPEYCTVTGERRDHPLYALVRQLNLEGFRVHVIRSRQLAPGLGGYPVRDLLEAARSVTHGKTGRWLLSTACKCHGIVTAFKLSPFSES
jgi:hypothetical protein